MALIGYRTFNGSTDALQTDIGTQAGQTSVPETWAVMARLLNSTADGEIVHTAGYDPIDFYFSNGSGDIFRFYDGGSNDSQGPGWATTDGWVIIVFRGNITGPAGGWSKAVHNGTSWSSFTHDSAGAVSGRPWPSSGSLSWCTGPALNADLACAAFWDTVLTDTQVNSLTTDLQAWENLAPIFLWRFDQTPVVDLVGNSSQVSLTGTTVSSGAPLDEGGTGPVTITASGSISGAGSITGSGGKPTVTRPHRFPHIGRRVQRSEATRLDRTQTVADFAFGTLYLNQPTAPIVTATGSISGTGTVSATGDRIRSRTGSISGLGTITAAGIEVLPRTGSISGVGTLSGSGIRAKLRTASLSGAGTLAGTGLSIVSRTVSISGAGTLTATGNSIVTCTGSISGAGTLSATGSIAAEVYLETFATSASLTKGVMANWRTQWDNETGTPEGQDNTQGHGPDIPDNIRIESGQLVIESGMQNYGESSWRANTRWNGTGTLELDVIGDDVSNEAQVVILILDKPYAFTSFDGENANGPKPQYGIGLYNGYVSRIWSNYTQTDYYQGGSPGPPNGTRELGVLQHWVFNFNSTHMWVTIDGDDIDVGETGAWSGRRIPFPSGFTLPGSYITLATHNHASVKYSPFAETTITYYDNLEFESYDEVRTAYVAGAGSTFGWELREDGGTAPIVHETTSLNLGTGATGAYLVLNTGTIDGDDIDGTSRLHYRLNGNSWHNVAFPNQSLSGNMANHSHSIPVTLSELVQGVNEIEVKSTDINSPQFVRYGNVQLVVVGGTASAPTTERTASLAGTGTLAATGVEIIPRTSSISGVGTLSGSGVPVKLRSGSMSGTGTLAAAGIELIPRTASMSGTGTLSVSGLELLPRTAAISGAGTLTGSGVRIAARTASVSGASTIAATGLRIAPRTATLTGTGTLTATGNAIAARSASMSGTGTLQGSWAAQGVKNASGSMSGTGTLTATGVRIVATSGSVNGTGILSATGIEVIPRTASLSGVGTLTGSGVRIALRTASMTGLATLAGSGISIVSASGSVSGTGSFTASGIEVIPRTGVISGIGTLAGSGVRVKLRTATISGLGTLSATGNISGQYTGSISGTGTLSATGIRVKFRTASLTGTGTLSGTGVRLALKTASFSGTGTLNGSGTRLSLKTATISGIGTTAATGTHIAPRSALISGVGTLAASTRKIVGRGGSITGAGTLAASFTGVIASRTASMIGAGSLSATGVRVKTATAVLAGAGVVVGSGVRVVTRDTQVTGIGSMTADYVIGQTSAGVMSGAGTLAASFMRIVVRSSTMSGTSSINAVLPVRVDYNELKSIGSFIYDQRTHRGIGLTQNDQRIYRGVGTTQEDSSGSRFTGIGQTQKIR